MIGDDRFSAVTPPTIGGLAHVLKDGEQLYALARSGGGAGPLAMLLDEVKRQSEDARP